MSTEPIVVRRWRSRACIEGTEIVLYRSRTERRRDWFVGQNSVLEATCCDDGHRHYIDAVQCAVEKWRKA